MIDRLKKLIAVLIVAVSIATTVTYGQPRAIDSQEQSQAPSTSIAQPQTKTPDRGQRRLAYLRYMEAQRLKGEAQAQRSRNSRLFDEAIKAYKETIQLDPTAAEPHVDLGELYFFYMSRRDLAEREGLEAVRLDPKSVGGNLLLARVYITIARMENNPRSVYLDRAIRQYERVGELDAGQAEAWALLAEMYETKGNTERRIQALEKWTTAQIPNDAFFYRWLTNSDLSPEQAYFLLSQIYLSQGKNQAAVDAARRAYESNADSKDFTRNLISILRAASSSDDELRVYSQLSKSFNTPALIIGYGAALVRAGRYAEAVERLRDYVKLDPSNASAVALLAIAQRRANQRPAAIETLKAGLSQVDLSTRVDLVIDLAEVYEEIGRDEEALAQYEQAFESFLGKGALTPVNTPLFSEVVNRVVRVCRRAGNQTKLQSVLTRVRRVLDEHNSLLDLIAIESLREDGKSREALELTRAAERRHPEDRAIKFTEALILNEMNRSQDGVDLLRGMVKGTSEYATDDAGVYLLLSNLQMQGGDLKTAERSARKALELNPEDGDSLIQLSSVLDRAGRHEESEKILRELLQRDPGNATALNNLGYFLLERGMRYQEALKLIEQAIVLEPINGSFLDSLGWAHYKLGNVEKARASLEKAMIYSRRNSTIHEHLGDVLRDLGRVSEARRHWEKALEYSVEADEMARLKVKLSDAK